MLPSKKNPDYTFVGTMAEMEKSSREWRGETGIITKAMLLKYIGDLTLPIFYITGPPAMVTAMRKTLSESGINGDNIRVEEFAGTILVHAEDDPDSQLTSQCGDAVGGRSWNRFSGGQNPCSLSNELRIVERYSGRINLLAHPCVPLQRDFRSAHKLCAARGRLPYPLLSLRKIVFLVVGLPSHLDQSDPDLPARRRHTGDAPNNWFCKTISAHTHQA